MRYTDSTLMPATLDVLLGDLEAARNDFSSGASQRIKKLLQPLASQELSEPKALLRFHEALLFLRAFPQSASVVTAVERLLDTFHKRIEELRASGGDMSVFDDFDTSGIAGTTMQDVLNFEVARWLVRRIPDNVEIAWDDYEEERAMGSTWPRFVPLLREDSEVEADIPWRRWLEAARGREKELAWLIRQFERWSAGTQTDIERGRAELYDSLRLPVRWRLENLKLSRTRNWRRPRKFFFHDGPLIRRKEVSLAVELSRPAPRLARVPRIEAEATMRLIREVMLVRYRELYGTTLGDSASVVRARLDRGVEMYFWNLPPSRRLPLRAYVAGFTLKNGVPVNYIEAIGLCEWIEVGFNTFYTYRHGETAWIYAQALRCLCALTGATTISVYPYQIGQDNDEALDSGAFWFYRKLGFRSGKLELEKLAREEEKKITANPAYRTPRRVLKRLADAHIFFETTSTEMQRGPWDTFSMRNIGIRVNRSMARGFDGNADRVREVSIRKVAKAMQLDIARWTGAEFHSLENWSLVLALIPDLSKWTPNEKRELVEIIRSQSGRNEMWYLRLTQRHARLRDWLLRLRSR